MLSKTSSNNLKKQRIMTKKDYTRNEIIAALRRFDESCIGDIFDGISTEELYERLDSTSKVFSAEDLILATKLGF